MKQKLILRRGSKNPLMLLRPSTQIQLGLRMLVFVAALFMTNFALAAVAALAPVVEPISKNFGLKVQFDKKGLDGDNLKLVEMLETRMNSLPDAPTKDDLVLEVRKSFEDFLNEKGKPKFDVSKLIEMLGDDDKGIRSILKKQGEEIAALREGGKRNKMSFRSMLNSKMEELETIVKNRKEGQQIKLNLRAAEPHQLDNTIEGHDELPEDLIESFSLGAFVGKRFPREYIFDIASRRTVSEISQYKTWLEEGDEEGAFAEVEEGAVKPLVQQKLVRNHSEYKKVAAKYVVTEEFAKFRRNAYSIIQRLIQQKILRDYAAILTADLVASAAPYVSSALDGQYENPTDYHAIAAVAAQIEALDFMPDVLILNPQDKWRIGMLQGEDGHFYLTIPITDPSGQTRMMGFIVRTSNRMEVGSFMLGESGLWEIEEESLTVRMGYGIDVTKSEGVVTEVESDFDRNRFRVIVENYFHNYIASNNAGSYVLAEFDVVKALLTTEEPSA